MLHNPNRNKTLLVIDASREGQVVTSRTTVDELDEFTKARAKNGLITIVDLKTKQELYCDDKDRDT